ncbi:MAG: hypothetical protein CMM94_02400 [Rickettsiales bacterium]|nr:hypothetical protein [Rickettsiales bacterium]
MFGHILGAALYATAQVSKGCEDACAIGGAPPIFGSAFGALSEACERSANGFMDADKAIFGGASAAIADTGQSISAGVGNFFSGLNPLSRDGGVSQQLEVGIQGPSQPEVQQPGVDVSQAQRELHDVDPCELGSLSPSCVGVSQDGHSLGL